MRLAEFWRWSKAQAARYNDLVNGIGAALPIEPNEASVHARHLTAPTTYVVSNWNPEVSTVGYLPGFGLLPDDLQATCEVRFTPKVSKTHKVFVVGYYWQRLPETPPGYTVYEDIELAIRYGTDAAWLEHLVDAPFRIQYMYGAYYGHTTGPLIPMTKIDGSPFIKIHWAYGGDKAHQVCAVFDGTLPLVTTRIGLFTPKREGTALLTVWAEDSD